MLALVCKAARLVSRVVLKQRIKAFKVLCLDMDASRASPSGGTSGITGTKSGDRPHLEETPAHCNAGAAGMPLACQNTCQRSLWAVAALWQ